MNRAAPALLALLLLTVPLQGCLSGDLPFTGSDGDPDDQDADQGDDDGGDDPPPGDGGDGPDEPPPIPDLDFNGTRAYNWVEEQVRFDNGTTRYRVPETPGARSTVRDLVKGLDDQGWAVSIQQWRGHYECEETRLVNVVATLPGHTGKKIILGAHYDTRPWSDQAENLSDRDQPVVGANDGASGVGALMEMARVLADHRPLNHTIKIVFFDAEDGGDPPPYLSDCNPDEHEEHRTPGGWIIGSSHYVSKMDQNQRNHTEAVIILDMVGYKNLSFFREESSYYDPHRDLQDRIWDHSEALGYDQWKAQVKGPILDDHRPFQRAGITAVDVIHLDDEGKTPFPPTWHATNDTLESVSADSLETVGRVVERTIFDLDRELGRP